MTWYAVQVAPVTKRKKPGRWYNVQAGDLLSAADVARGLAKKLGDPVCKHGIACAMKTNNFLRF